MPAILHSPYAQTKPPPGSQLDWSHPLARGLVMAYNYTGEVTTKSVRDILGLGVGNFTFANAATLVPGRFGSMAPYSSGTTIASISASSLGFGGAYSWLLWFKPDITAFTTAGQPLIQTTQQTFGFSWGHPTAGFRQAAFHRTAGGTYVPVQIPTTRAAQRWYCIVVTYDMVRLSVYFDGVFQASATAAVGSASPFTIELQTAATAELGVTDHALIWRNRSLSPSEVQQIYNEPFAMLRGPATFRRMWVPGASAPIELSGAGAVEAEALAEATGLKTADEGAAESAIATVAATGVKKAAGAAETSVVASVAATGIKQALGVGVAEADGNSEGAGTGVHAGSANAEALAGSVAGGAAQKLGAGAAEAAGLIVGSGNKHGAGLGAVEAAAEVTAGTTEAASGSGGVGVEGDVGATGIKQVQAAGAAEADAAIAAAGRKRASGSASLSAVVAVTATGRAIKRGAGATSARADVAVSFALLRRGAAAVEVVALVAGTPGGATHSGVGVVEAIATVGSVGSRGVGYVLLAERAATATLSQREHFEALYS